MLPLIWKPAKVGGLIRVGPKYDGGYVVSHRVMKAARMLVSMGLNDDWRFEEDFVQSTGAPIVCFDGTVDNYFWALYAVKKAIRLRPWKALHYFAYRRFFASNLAEHRRQMIGYDGPNSVSLSTIMLEINIDDILLKIDIEGGEYRILDQIVENRERCCGVVMELHDVDLQADRITAFLNAMTGFTLVCMTSNNFGGVDPAGDPLVIEISLMRDDLVDEPSLEENPIPVTINAPGHPDIPLRFASN